MYQAPRGTSDILPDEQVYWYYIKQQVADSCQRYGYQRIDTPLFEDSRLFSRSVGEETDIVDKEMYTFKDKGGNQLTLRPEGTASVCRAYVEHGMYNLPQPVKLYYLAPIFRYERPQAGRFRQHYQFGYEAFGDDDSSLDAEVIDMAWQFFRALGLNSLLLKLNSIGCKECRPNYLAVLRDYYTKHTGELCPDCKARLARNPLRLLDCKRPSCQQIARLAPKSVNYLCPQCEAHFSQLKKHLGRLGLPFTVDNYLVRGLDYYTRTVFEIQPEVEGGQSTLGGGGRYDSLIEELGGSPTPAIGFAAGIERIILNLKRQGVVIPPLPKPKVCMAHIGDIAAEEAIRLAATLRRAGISVVATSSGKSLKAQLRQANTLQVSYTIIIGKQEVEAGTVVLRDMATSEQQIVPVDQLLEQLS
ncbi:MAG: histidine--tRNA ligase [Dehalococcoidales bacterium]|nr:histidine--tRNA ligase [Dehalococcoidales bacterium]